MKIGPFTIGRETKKTEPSVQTVEIPVVKAEEKKEKVFLGSMLDMPTALSTDKTVSDKLIKAYEEWVYANVSTISEEVAKLDIKVYTTNFRGGNLVLEESDQHPLLDVLDKFNDSTTSSDGFYTTQAHLELAGDTFWLLLGNAPDIKAIMILQPDMVELDLAEFTDGNTKLINAYKYKVVVDGKEKEVTYQPEEIIPFKVPDPSNAYRGKSTVAAAATTIDTDTLSMLASKKFYEQGMIANFALVTENKLNPDQVKEIQAQLRNSRTGVKNAFKVPILSGGLTPVPLQMSNKEVELIKQQEWLRDKLMAIFKNTKASLGIVEDVNRANAEESLTEWRRSVIKPKMQRIVDSLNEYLVPKYGDNIILGFEDPVPEDRAAKLDEAVKLYGEPKRAVITLNEARGMLEYDDVPDGDKVPEIQDPSAFGQNLPQPIKNVNWQRHFRRMKLYSRFADYRKTFAMTKAAVIAERKVLKQQPKKPSKTQVNNFWRRIVEIIERYEDVFSHHMQSFILEIAEEALQNIDNEDSRRAGDLFDREKRILQAQAQFGPILMQALVLAGKEANTFLGIDEPFVPKKIKQLPSTEFIKEQIELFAIGMMDTDKQILAEILAEGLKEGRGIPAIKEEIQEKFAVFSKTQAERITRTEVSRAANRGVTDSYAQHGITKQQWLTAPGACPYCQPLNGKIVKVTENFFNVGDQWLGEAETPLKLDYTDIGEPPLHPNCRCTTIAVTETFGPLLKPKEFNQESYQFATKLANKIQELEDKVDKRTKEFRDLKKRKLEDEEYIKQLEAIADD